MLEVKDAMSANLLENSEYVVIDLYSQTCGPCKQLEPVIKELAGYDADVVVGKGEVNNNMELALTHNVRQVPTVLFFKNGELVNRVTGFKPLNELKSLVDELKK